MTMTNHVGISPLQESTGPLSDEELVSRLRILCRRSKRTEVEIIRLLVILQARHLDLHWTYSSFYKFCAERLGMTEGEATRRVAAARLISNVPVLLEYLRAGKLSMTTLLCLRDYITPENANELLANVVSKSRREVQIVLANRTPHTALRRRKRGRAEQSDLTGDAPAPPEEVGYRVDVLSGSALHSKIERARALMGHGATPGALVAILDAALDALLEQSDDTEVATSNAEENVEISRHAVQNVSTTAIDGASSNNTRGTERIRSHRKGPARKPLGEESGVAERPRRARPRSETASAISQALRRPLKHRRNEPRPRDRATSKSAETSGRRARPSS